MRCCAGSPRCKVSPFPLCGDIAADGARGEQVFEALAAKHHAKAAKPQAKAPEKHIIPGAVPVSQAEFKVRAPARRHPAAICLVLVGMAGL